jgi:SH3 domain
VSEEIYLARCVVTKLASMLDSELPYSEYKFSLSEGEILEVIDPTQEGWWQVKLSDGTEIGMFLL